MYADWIVPQQIKSVITPLANFCCKIMLTLEVLMYTLAVDVMCTHVDLCLYAVTKWEVDGNWYDI